MDRNETKTALMRLRDKTQEYEDAIEELGIFENKLQRAETRQPVAVSEFDDKHMEPYIVSHIGHEPIEPSLLTKLIRPSKKRDYERACAIYDEKREECISEYFCKFATERSRLEAEELTEIANDIKRARQKYRIALEKTKRLKKEVDEYCFLGENLKKADIIDTLIEYFHDMRADSIKEAVNLYFEEEHRHRLEEAAQEQLRLTEEALNLAREALEKAEAAVDSASEAQYRADQAYELADKAYDKAKEACEQAEQGYE